MNVKVIPLLCLMLMLGFIGSSAFGLTYDIQITDGNDDAEEDVTDGAMYRDSSDLELINDGNDQVVGMRFRSVSIPAGATITSAYVEFECDEGDSGTTNLRFYGEAVDDADDFSDADGALPGALLRDWGLYTQVVWGFARNWDAGLRYEYASGSGSDVTRNDDGSFAALPRSADPFRDDRHRIAPLLTFRPTEFSRPRLQYNYDHVEHLADSSVHTGWLGLEFLFGSHPAHAY